MFCKLFFTILVILSFATFSHADLSPSTLNKLIEESDLIAFGELLLVDYQSSSENIKGKASVKLKEIIYNKSKITPEKTLWIKWSDEEHDQPIDQPGERLLFLKKDSAGEWAGTHYGRSYLSIYSSVEFDDCKKYAVYEYPLNMVSVPKELIQDISKEKEINKELLCMDLLIPYIQKQVK